MKPRHSCESRNPVRTKALDPRFRGDDELRKNSKHYTLLILLFLILVPCIVFYFSFPAELNDRSSVQSVEITDRNGVPLRDILGSGGGRSKWVGLSGISRHMVDALITAEDGRFYYHAGIDPAATFRAIVQNIAAKKVISGGSTITQQLVRIIRPRKRTVPAKLYEAILALRIELSLAKNEILEQYLNRAPFGNQLFGIEAASEMYFDKPARDLSIAEAAYLAILPRAPSAYNPYREPEKTARLCKQLIERMCKDKKISHDEMEAALRHEVRPIPRRYPFRAPHFVDMLVSNDLTNAGNKVETSIDIPLQERAEQIVESHIKMLEKYNVTNAAAVVMDNKTGEILALIGSRNYDNNDISGQVNGAASPRQPGSSLKPFTYALALESGYTPATIIPDIPLSFPTEKGDYTPQNYSRRFHGPVRLRNALANSLNVPAVHTLSKIGTEKLLAKLKELGFTGMEKNANYYGLGLTLGNSEVTLLELTAAYSALARGGLYLPPGLLAGALPRAKPRRVFSKEAAYMISDILSDDGSRRMSFGEDSPLDLPFRAAAKTGTSKDFRDNWTVGFTPEFTVGVWTGNFDASPMHGVSGITGAAPIFRSIFLAISETNKLSWFKEPEKIVHKKVCPLSGALVSVNCPNAIDEIFMERGEPKGPCAFHVEHSIDARNGLLASKSCGSEWVQPISFIELPYEYHEWAALNNIQMPPRKYSPLCPLNTANAGTTGQPAERSSPRPIKITHPMNKAVYSIDPYIPERLQTLFLKAEGDEVLTWYADGRELANTNPPHGISWRLEDGRHKFSISSRDGKSDEIEITVVRPYKP